MSKKYSINSLVYISSILIEKSNGKTCESIKWEDGDKDYPVHRKIKAKVISYNALGTIVLLPKNENFAYTWKITESLSKSYNIPKEYIGNFAIALKDEFILGKAFLEKKKICKICKNPSKKEFLYL